MFNYFKDEQKPIKDIVADINEKDVSKSKDLEILASKQRNEISLLTSRIAEKDKELEKIKTNFKIIEFKKTTFGNNVTASFESINEFRLIIGCSWGDK